MSSVQLLQLLPSFLPSSSTLSFHRTSSTHENYRQMCGNAYIRSKFNEKWWALSMLCCRCVFWHLMANEDALSNIKCLTNVLWLPSHHQPLFWCFPLVCCMLWCNCVQDTSLSSHWINIYRFSCIRSSETFNKCARRSPTRTLTRILKKPFIENHFNRHCFLIIVICFLYFSIT